VGFGGLGRGLEWACEPGSRARRLGGARAGSGAGRRVGDWVAPTSSPPGPRLASARPAPDPASHRHPHPPQTPIALASTAPERRVRPALERLDLDRTFAAIVTAEDNGSAELENSYLAASHMLQRPPLRCVVLGDGNRSVEAARELGMKSVVVTGGQPAWEFGAADLVVRNLGALTFANMKNLFSQEDLVESSTPWDEINESRQRDEEEGVGRAGSSFDSLGGPLARGGSSSGWSASSAGGGGELAAAGSLASTAGSGWRPGSGAREREREPAGAAAAAAAGGYQERRGGGGGGSTVGGSEDEEDDFEVVLPPKGAAFWDL
jgi:hypothetical protein